LETRANNVLVGAFALALIALALGLVYWVSRGEGAGDTKTYRVLFNGSITGLAKGSTVLFNGIQVGQVTTVELVPDDPSRVAAIITVERITPVKPDTKARLEYIGLTGIAAIQLSGGSAFAPALEDTYRDGMPVIRAERSDFQDLVEAGRVLAARAEGVLEKIESLIGDNEASVRGTVANIERFSRALGDNSASVDQLLKDAGQLGGKLNLLADRLNTLIGDAGALAGSSEGKGLLGEVTAAAKSVRVLAERLDARTAEITQGLSKFSGGGLKEYETLAVDGRRTLNDLNRVLRKLEQDPQQLLFGKGRTAVPESSGR
jgi:phospholipid/cholesterol/gamma-HCH transport system substrate-binding protein